VAWENSYFLALSVNISKKAADMVKVTIDDYTHCCRAHTLALAKLSCH